MYLAAAYCRLSREDGENRISESIVNQIKIIQEYVKKTDQMTIVEHYIDDGYSGMHFENRPAFRQMLEDIEKGKINTVITKDISRLGREHITTSDYMERIFPAKGVRYIAVLDGVDSITHDNEELAQFKTLFNDMYCRDISRKITGALMAKKKNGEYAAGFTPYGYVKNPKDMHKLVVDKEAAAVVRKIFALYMEGYSMNSIAKRLNEQGILTPSEYKRRVLKLNYKNALERDNCKGWSYPTINYILRNPVYTGDLISHKTRKLSYKLDKEVPVKKEEQLVAKDNHQAIIDKDTFQKVNEVLKGKTRRTTFTRDDKSPNIYAGIIRCRDCGFCMYYQTKRKGYECATYHQKGNELCSSHFIKKEQVDEMVKREILAKLEVVLDGAGREELESLRGQVRTERDEGEELVRKQLEEELNNIEKYKKKIYEDYVDGILERKEIKDILEEYRRQEERLKKQWDKQLEYQSKNESKENWMEEYLRVGNISKLDRGLVTLLVKEILVGNAGWVQCQCLDNVSVDAMKYL